MKRITRQQSFYVAYLTCLHWRISTVRYTHSFPALILPDCKMCGCDGALRVSLWRSHFGHTAQTLAARRAMRRGFAAVMIRNINTAAAGDWHHRLRVLPLHVITILISNDVPMRTVYFYVIDSKLKRKVPYKRGN